jgi:cytochrome c553
MVRIVLSTAAVTALLSVAPARSAAKPDLELGRYLAAECMTCHRTATATSTIPNIFGLAENHLSDVMKAYREKKLPNPVMQSIAGRLTDEEIAALAHFFSITKKP